MARAAVDRVARDPSSPLDEAVRGPAERALGLDLGGVRVHRGDATRELAEALDARAFTFGQDIFLGADVECLGKAGREEVLNHEIVHTVQQRGQDNLQPNVPVSKPEDAAETQAQQVASTMTAPSGWQAGAAGRTVTSQSIAVVPLSVQRDIKGSYKTKNGTFTINAVAGMSGALAPGLIVKIAFRASSNAPPSEHIRLVQAARDVDLTTGAEYEWTGGDADRNKMRTKEDKSRGVFAGYFIDHHPSLERERQKKGQAASPYYADSQQVEAWKNIDGAKVGDFVLPATLTDTPSASGKRRFSFETAARDAESGYIYATLAWGFTISDPANGTITGEHAAADAGPSATLLEALKLFDQFYKRANSTTGR